MALWVDTDFGFDDLWALLLLRHLKCSVGGVSLVAGNTPLTQVEKNALSAKLTFDFSWPVYSGAATPLQRTPETAVRVLGEHGMRTRGRQLPYEAASASKPHSTNAVDALAKWLMQGSDHQILALGPLTNLATLAQQYPTVIARIEQITWMGGSRGRGNHSQFAEYNALADPESLAIVSSLACPFRMIELELCRGVGFSEQDIPEMTGPNRQLLSDLLGGYLDIALQRQRPSMSIYDPIAALAVADTASVTFENASLFVDTDRGKTYGRTVINDRPDSQFQLAVGIDQAAARDTCMAALINN